MGIYAGFLLMVLILQSSRQLEHRMEGVVSGDLRREKIQNSSARNVGE